MCKGYETGAYGQNGLPEIAIEPCSRALEMYERSERFKKALEHLKQLAIDSLDITQSYNLNAVEVVNVIYEALSDECGSEAKQPQGEEE